MKYLEIIKKWGKLTSAQISANSFYICYGGNKSIKYEDASASVYVKKLSDEDIKLIQQSIIENTNYKIYPHHYQIEIWFY